MLTWLIEDAFLALAQPRKTAYKMGLPSVADLVGFLSCGLPWCLAYPYTVHQIFSYSTCVRIPPISTWTAYSRSTSTTLEFFSLISVCVLPSAQIFWEPALLASPPESP